MKKKESDREGEEGKWEGRREEGKKKKKNTNSYWQSVLIFSGIHGNQWEQTGTSTIPL